jgi:UDP-N-acetylmuramate--alanine ligase
LFDKDDDRLNQIKLQIPGDFNKLNALCALILGQILNIDRESILNKFAKFKGSWRRFEILGRFYNMTVISDYAHHPTAIKKTIKATHEKYPDSKICCIFQPHQYNRTKKFLIEFGEAFKNAQTVILPDIYKVRDKKEDIESIKLDDLAESIRNNGTEVVLKQEYEEIKKYLEDNKNEYDILLVMGAGDIWKFAEYYLPQNNKEFCENCMD